ncbi:hypothetical protein [Aeromonas dhakensis]|uniref:hypothetical protein n=1 Tax=Aeromonas dhakensis TaxID=196024 RepID=UPI001B37AF3E|nr:hypothetical protein [Aeromonas dhakensis]MBQ4681640.1 hypothetical protein [Aeromonas dhakensis]
MRNNNDNFFNHHSANLTSDEIKERVQQKLENGDFQSPADGVARQFLNQGLDSLSTKQLNVFYNYIVPTLVERCSITNCTNPTKPGQEYCDMHEIEYSRT